MQDYYRCAQAIFQTSKDVESASRSRSAGLERAKVPIREALKIARLRRARRVDGFVVRGHELAAETRRCSRTTPCAS